MNRFAFDKIVQLYKTSPVFQDLIETAIGTGVAAGSQALLTDMSPQEIALASGATFGAGMVGRPIAGRIGQALGGVVDRKAPQFGKEVMADIYGMVDAMPGPIGQAYHAKLGPYAHMGGMAQYGNLLGRGIGDNLAQAIVALAAPGVFDGTRDKEEK